MYCDVSKSFNYSQIPKSESKKYNDELDTNFDNYSNVSINKFDVMDDNICPAFFTAQGDYSNQGPYKAPDKSKNKGHNKGKTVAQLREENKTMDSDTFSLVDSEFSNDSLFDPSILQMKNQKKKKMSHEYYIEKMVKSLLEDHDSNPSSPSTVSSNNNIYKHVKSCKICKDRINKKMKEYFKPELQIKEQDNKNNKGQHNNLDLGYDLKEVLIIILAGVVLIFILDLLVKIGKRLK